VGPVALLIDRLRAPPSQDGLTLEPFAEHHREGLRAACAEDPEIWAIYPNNWIGTDFDPNFDGQIANPKRIPFVLFEGDRLIGMSCYLDADADQETVQIGGTYWRPSARGTGFNDRAKRLMIGHAFACGARRVEFMVDDRNVRSKAAVAKIGGVPEGVLRSHRRTWTGHIRDTAIFSILKGEWQ
jgi:RimJ/RimL family protein N-acetyltransferase